MEDVLDAIVNVADKPIKYTIENYGVMFSLKTGQETAALSTRRFKVDPDTFYKGLESASSHPVTRTNVVATLRDCFKGLGVELTPPKSVFFGERAGELLVRATIHDLAIIEKALQAVCAAPPQVSIKVKFVEISATDSGGGLNLFLGNLPPNVASAGGFPGSGAASTSVAPNVNDESPTGAPANAGASPTLIGILTEPQFRAVVHALEQRDGTDLLNAPEVLIPSGCQAQIQVVDLQNIVTGDINPKALTPPGVASTNVFQTVKRPFGLVVDVLPTVSADRFTINMTVTPSASEFLGYNEPTSTTTIYINGQETNTFLPLPTFRSRQTTATVNVRDGQTLVLGNLTDLKISKKPDGKEEVEEFSDPKKKHLLVFITPTVIDPAGNRLHPGN